MAVKKKNDEMKFEEALSSLEKIVEEMESAEMPLDEVLQKYEKGIELSRFCTKKLTEAEGKIEFLSKKKAQEEIPSILSEDNVNEEESPEIDLESTEKDSLF